MLFNSLTVIVFFVIVVTLYWGMGSWTARKNLLVVASSLFYGAWNPPFAALLFSTTAMDYWLGGRVAPAPGRRLREVWLVGGRSLDLWIVGFFLYWEFFLGELLWFSWRPLPAVPAPPFHHP